METVLTAEQVYQTMEELLRRTRRLRTECECTLREAERRYALEVGAQLGAPADNVGNAARSNTSRRGESTRASVRSASYAVPPVPREEKGWRRV